MKIKTIELNWFRGASERAELIANGKSAVIYGENGSGKSSFVDALEYILTNCRIDHLRIEYADRSGQRNCVRNTETPDDFDARAVIKFINDTQVSVSIPNERRITFQSTPKELINSFKKWKRQSHILRQDEVADFINKTKSGKYSVLSPLIGLQKFEDIFENMKKLERHIKNESNYKVLVFDRDKIKEDLSIYVGSYDEVELINTLHEKIRKYGIAYEKDISTTSEKAIMLLQKRIDRFDPKYRRHFVMSILRKSNLLKLITEYRNIVEEVGKRLTEHIGHKIFLLEHSNLYLSWEELAGEIECPVCGTTVCKSEIVEHVQQELEALKELREISNDARNKKREIIRALQLYKTQFQDRLFQDWIQTPETSEMYKLSNIILKSELPDEYTIWDFRVLEIIEDTILKIQKLLRAIPAERPPSMRDLRMDYQFFNNAPLISKYQELEKKISKIDILYMEIVQARENIRKKIVEITVNTLETISVDIQELWKILHEKDPIEEIRLEKSQALDTGIDITLKFHGRNQLSPSLTLSEGHRNSLGLCVFLALAKQEPEDHPIILDDIVSSLDRDHRGFLVDVFNNELGDRQVLLFTHDREWYDELKRRLDRRNWTFYYLKKWKSPTEGIQVSPTHFTFDQARSFLPDETNAAGNACRAIMDDELARICEKLEVSLPFVRGPNNDHRTWYDFFESLISQGGTNFRINDGTWTPYQDALDCWKEARDLLVTWGNRSSHGRSLTEEEANRMIDRCRQSLNYFKCPDCNKPVWFLKRENQHLRCDCDKTRWKI